MFKPLRLTFWQRFHISNSSFINPALEDDVEQYSMCFHPDMTHSLVWTYEREASLGLPHYQQWSEALPDIISPLRAPIGTRSVPVGTLGAPNGSGIGISAFCRKSDKMTDLHFGGHLAHFGGHLAHFCAKIGASRATLAPPNGTQVR